MDTTENSTQESAQVAEQSTPQIFDTQAQAPASEASWHWGEEMPGEGDKPEWFKDSKYKSVSEQAKAYTELEKRLGGFIGAPTEGYQLAEDLSEMSSDPAIQAVLDLMGKNNASNEFANELISTYVATQEAQAETRLANEMKLLGDNADYRIQAIKEFSSSALPSHLQDTFGSMVTTAGAVEVIEALMKKAQGAAVAPEATTSSTKMDGSKLRDMMMATNEHGQMKASIDPEYKRMVDKAYREFYGA